MRSRKTRLVTDYTLGASNFSESTSEHRLTAGSNSRIKVLAISVKNDANETIVARHYTAGDISLQILMSEAATTSTKAWPQNDVNAQYLYDCILGPGQYISVVLGGAQGAAAHITFHYEEVTA